MAITPEAEKDITAIPAHIASLDSVASILDSSPQLLHLKCGSPISDVADAPITELALVYFPSPAKTNYPELWSRFIKNTAVKSDGFLNSCGGWIVEELDYEGQEGKAAAFYGASSWQVPRHTPRPKDRLRTSRLLDSSCQLFRAS